ncbi:non-homologous end-joining DNA ligase [Nonomuraea ferruginea]
MASPYIELEVGDRTVKVTNPGKIYFPEIGATKRELVEYYVSVGEGALRALRDRPTNLKRHPDGVQSEAIYQKRMPAKRPDWVETATVTFPSGRTAESLKVTEVAAIAYCANLGTIDFHPWQVRASDVEHPDELRVDLDPQPGVGFDAVRKAAFLTRDVLEELGMPGFVKTSGNRGVHIAVRIEPRWDFVQVRHAGIALARAVEERDPGLVTTAWWKEERGDRVFIDFNQNARDRTVVSAYSVRARPHAPVSTPLTWSELEDADPRDFDIRTVPARFAELGGTCTPPSATRPTRSRPSSTGTTRTSAATCPIRPTIRKMPGEPKRVQPSKARDD